jgi:FixJ family two-component response regulator
VTSRTLPRPLVVIVEDDPASRKSLERVLRMGGFDAAMFASAEEFFASALRAPPIGMLLDLQLVGLSGLDLQRRLRTEGSTLPIIVITAQEDPRFREEAERLGCMAYLSKPCNGATILALLRSLVTDAGSPN